VNVNILAIDLDITMGDWLQSILDERCFRVEFANLNVDGIQAIHKYEPDIIILNLISTRIEEITLCKQIRHQSNAPLLVLSALNKPSIVAQLLDDGADNFLCKPVRNDVLIAHIKTLLRRRRFQYVSVHVGTFSLR
jgi:DNA-binding response OmpR family regulator